MDAIGTQHAEKHLGSGRLTLICGETQAPRQTAYRPSTAQRSACRGIAHGRRRLFDFSRRSKRTVVSPRSRSLRKGPVQCVARSNRSDEAGRRPRDLSSGRMSSFQSRAICASGQTDEKIDRRIRRSGLRNERYHAFGRADHVVARSALRI